VRPQVILPAMAEFDALLALLRTQTDLLLLAGLL
jgi:hypothetical protein